MFESLIGTLKATGKSLESLDELLVEQLKELCDVEDRMVDCLPKLIDKAESPMLKQALQQHLEQTRVHKRRLEQVFNMLGVECKSCNSSAMKGLVEQCCFLVKATGDAAVCDAALIAGCQRMEHYEMSCYGTARTFAQMIGRSDVATVLQQTLDEESLADEKLTQVALAGVNQQAAMR